MKAWQKCERLMLIIAATIVVGCGSPTDEVRRGAISFTRIRMEKSKEFDFVAGPRTVTLKADVEYPVRWGLAADDYEGMVSFINRTLNGGTNIDETVNKMAADLFEALAPLQTNENLKADADLNLEIRGEVHYADERYLSCEMSMRGVLHDIARAVYDRKLQKSLKVCDLIETNDFPKLRLLLRDHLSLLFTEEIAADILKGKSADWPVINENFYLNTDGIDWLYEPKDSATGSWTSYFVPWEKLKPILRDPSLIPSGEARYGDDKVIVRQGDGELWWDVPYSTMEISGTTPPNPPWPVSTNYPYADFKVNIKKPMQGSMSDVKYRALLDFIGSAISHGATPHATIDEAVKTEEIVFWRGVIKEMRNTGGDDAVETGYDLYEMEGEMKYCDERYFCYAVRHQHGCPCCCGETNVVWRWDVMRPLQMSDLIDTKKNGVALKKLMRKAVYEDFKDAYSDNMEVVLPDYAKDWPHTFENFYVSDKGVAWCFDAGEVLIGGKGPTEVLVTWKDLKRFIIDQKLIPRSE